MTSDENYLTFSVAEISWISQGKRGGEMVTDDFMAIDYINMEYKVMVESRGKLSEQSCR